MHPISIGITLLIQTILTCILTGIITKSFWFSYILFLIFIGGILVLFIYISSLAPNEKFNLDIKIITQLILIILMVLILINLDNFIFNLNQISYEREKFDTTNLLKENFLSSSKIYDLPNNYIVIFIINYLLLNLIIIVKITNIYQGPLRAKNN